MKFFRLYDVESTRVNPDGIIAYHPAENFQFGKKTPYFIHLTHNGGIAMSGTSNSFRESQFFVSYANEKDRDADLARLDAL